MGRNRQQGLVLVLVLLVLIITLLAGLSVMRTVQAGNAMAGNVSFRKVGLAASERALSDALNDIATRVAASAGNVTEANRYLSLIDPLVDARSAPASIDWTLVPCVDEKGAGLACTGDDGRYRVQYVVERRCSAVPDLNDISDIRARCEYEPHAGAGSPSAIALRYRVLIRVRGPRGTEDWAEAMVSGPARP